MSVEQTLHTFLGLIGVWGSLEQKSELSCQVAPQTDWPPVPPKWQVELLYLKLFFHGFVKGKAHVVLDEITPLWGGPPVDRSKHTLCGLPTAQSQRLDERELDREQIYGSCLRNLRLFRLPKDNWRKRGQYLREYRYAKAHDSLVVNPFPFFSQTRVSIEQNALGTGEAIQRLPASPSPSRPLVYPYVHLP